MYTVAIIDDDLNALGYMRTILDDNVNIGSVDVYDNSNDFIQSLKIKYVDMVFIRVEAEALNGISATRRVLDTCIDIKVVLISDTGYYAILAFDLGAEAYLINPVLDIHIDQLIQSIKRRQSCLTVA